MRVKMLLDIWYITKKELKDYFSSSAALLFLAIFLLATNIIFFWVEGFFSRNLADLRPLFTWIPILFVFLIAALTMHSWSEERRTGTIELILTSSVSPWSYLFGKFFAVLALIIVALMLTLPLPFTVSYMGDIDWGPIIGGYVAALFLAAAYISIGLWASAHTENQIVSLILAIIVSGVFYALGSATVTNLFNYEMGEWLRSLGAGSRFESITRGVLDLRDIVYYLSIIVAFLLFARLKLESIRWSNNFAKRKHNINLKLILVTIVILAVVNTSLSYLKQARLDLTEGQVYSLSNATKNILTELDKPLLLRGYFSSSTHPLLAPLVPRVQDLLNEYAVQNSEYIKVEFIDPKKQQKFEEEAGMKYGIRPVSFHSENKYQTSVINTYFNLLVVYDDQYEVLNYKDLVELKSSAGKHEVDLNNPEYLITWAIRNVKSKASREIDSFTNLTDLLVLNGYVSDANILPHKKLNTLNVIQDVSDKLRTDSKDNFEILLVNPDDDQLSQEYLTNELGARPHASEDVIAKPYWFYFTLTDGKKTIPVSFPLDADKASVEKNIYAAYKRLLPDSTKTAALLRPLPTPGPAGVIESPGIPKYYSILRKSLQQSMQVVDVDLRDGVVPDHVDFLMIMAPRYLAPVQIDAVKNFLIGGGTVLLSSSTIDVNVSHFTEVYPMRSGLEPWLESNGIKIENTLVLDPQHGKYSLPMTRRAGDLGIRETQLVNYPYIVDVRGTGLNEDNGVTAKLGQLYVPWVSPISIDQTTNQGLSFTPLLYSSNNSWTSDSQSILPDFESNPDIGFVTDNNAKKNILAVLVEGSFASNAINDSGESRLIVVGSGALFTDNFIDQMSKVLRSEYQRPIQFMQNLIDWSLEDQNLLDVLQKHTQFTRTLKTLDEQQKTKWEYFNYGLGLFGLFLLGLIRFLLEKKSKMRGLRILQSA